MTVTKIVFYIYSTFCKQRENENEGRINCRFLTVFWSQTFLQNISCLIFTLINKCKYRLISLRVELFENWDNIAYKDKLWFVIFFLREKYSSKLICTVWNFRCPDPQKPCSVLYNQDTDRLEVIGDSHESADTDDGPVSLSGTSIKLYLTWNKRSCWTNLSN